MQSGIDTATANLEQWLVYLEAVHPSEIDLGLDRLRQVAQRLNVLTLPCEVVTVAGTNGKGSTVAMLDSVLRCAGYKVGCYTSPHFLRYNERICLDGEPVSDELICQAFARIEQARKDPAGDEISLTYFEFGTLAAFLIFAEQKPDIAVLEIGLGGRLDAANLIDPDLSIVTTVALDHESWLGSDLEQIGREKAGIFRPGVPALIGSPAGKIPNSVRETAEALGCGGIYQLGKEYNWLPEGSGQDAESTSDREKTSGTANLSEKWQWQQLSEQGELKQQYLNLPHPGLPVDNAATVIQAVKLMRHSVPTAAIYQGIEQASLTGRMQRIGRFLLDVAHNPHAANYVVQQLHKHQQLSQPLFQRQGGKRIALVGMLDDKDIEAVLDITAPYFDQWYVAQLDGPRATPAERIVNYLHKQGCQHCQAFDSVSLALDQVLQDSREEDQVLVFGSFFTVAGVLAEKERLLP